MKSIYLKYNFITTLLILLLSSNTLAQTSRFPISVSFNVPLPHQQSLIGYVASEGRLNASLQFNGNANQWDTRLRLTIEGITNNVRIQTDPNTFIEPLRLNQFELTSLSTADLTPYFDYANAVYKGISARNLESNGGALPEGMYRFCLEALDNRTLTPLSNQVCANVNIIVRQPPLLNRPTCGEVIKFSQQQNFSLSWGSVPGISDYRLTIAEVLEGRTPMDALEVNNPNMETFEVMGNFFQIPQDAFLRLKQGHQYVYRVRAVDPLEQTNLFNDGLSTICTFQYGYKVDGSLTLTEPANQEVIPPVASTVFKWSSPNNLSKQQQLNYRIRIVAIEEGDDPDDAIQNNTTVYADSTRYTNGSSEWSMRLRESLVPEKKYAWQVKAFTEGIEIAASEVRTFETSPLISEVHAGKHVIAITTLEEGTTFSNFSGKGTLILDADSNRYEVSFANLEVQLYSGRIILKNGTITYDLPEEFEDISLTPKEAKNAEAIFYPEKVQLDKYALQIFGQVRWDLPFLMNEGSKQDISSKKIWANYDELRINDKFPLESGNYFNFLDPYDLRLLLLEDKADFLVSNNTYQQRFFGQFILPGAIDGNEMDSVSFQFRNFNQLFYNRMEENASNGLALSSNAKFHLVPKITVFDLDDGQSPGIRSSDQIWKGVYFEQYDVVLEKKFDSNHFVLPETITHPIVQGQSTDHEAEVSTSGLQFRMKLSYDSSDLVTFNTFGGHLRQVEFSIVDNLIEKGLFEASIHVPFIRDEVIDCEVTLTDEGFENDQLQTDLSFHTIAFGDKTSDDRFHASATLIETPYFDAFNALKTDLDFRWDHFEITLDDVTDLKIWGNGKVGFNTPGGRYQLDEYVVARLDQYEITVFDLGFELYKSIYAASTGYQISFGEDITGRNGNPVASEFITARGFDRPRYQSSTGSDPGALENPAEVQQPSLIGEDRTDLNDRRKILDNQTSHWGNFTEGNDSFYNHHKAGEGAMKNFSVEPYSSFYFKMNLLVIIAEFSGFRVKDDPEWGDCTTGFGSALIRFPFEYNGSAKITLGKTTGDDPFNYWMFDVSYGMGEFANITNPIDDMIYKKLNSSDKDNYGIGQRVNAAEHLEYEKQEELERLIEEQEDDINMSKLREKEDAMAKAQQELDLLRDKSTDREYQQAKDAYENADRVLEERIKELEAPYTELKKEIDHLQKESIDKKKAFDEAKQRLKDHGNMLVKNPKLRQLQEKANMHKEKGEKAELAAVKREYKQILEGLQDHSHKKDYEEKKRAYEQNEATIIEKKKKLKKTATARFKREIDYLKKDRNKKRDYFKVAANRKNQRREIKKVTTIDALEEKVARLKKQVKKENDRLSPEDLDDLKKLKSKELELEKEQKKYNDFIKANKHIVEKEEKLEKDVKEIPKLIDRNKIDIVVNDSMLKTARQNKANNEEIAELLSRRSALQEKHENLTKKMNDANALLNEHNKWKGVALYNAKERLRKKTENIRNEIDKIKAKRTQEWSNRKPEKSAFLDKKSKELSKIKTYVEDRETISERDTDPDKVGALYKNTAKRLAGSQKNALTDQLKGTAKNFRKRPNSAMFPNVIVRKEMTGVRKALLDGIPMGPITMTGGMVRVFKHMNYDLDDDTKKLIDTYNGATGTDNTEDAKALADLLRQSTVSNAMAGSTLGTSTDNSVVFKPDRNVIGGMTVATSIIDTPTFGATFSGTATLDVGFGESGFFRLDTSMDLFNMRTISRVVDYSMFQSRATAFFSWDKKGLKTGALTADFVTGSNVLCGEGDLAFLYYRESDFHNVILEVGKPDKRVYLLPGCLGMRWSTYFKYSKLRAGTDLELHLAAGLGAEFRTPQINLQVVVVKGRAKAFIDLGLIVGAEINPKFRFTKVGGFLEGNIGAYIDYEVPVAGKYGTLTIAEFYALARILGTWPEDKPMNVEADVLVRFKVIGMSKEITFNYKKEIG
ncbi:hypothetical protein FNH22_06135 [Fulvivirga sp. M361]|uniref:hypothetical protein n=1 Tax=Fulvivirga sp. M361 TaxID=2594266 RepID=UPI001179D57D|nr:hypothetical protein [Fulvivirga sp. M361]TRX60622.1 hypothetical protein FNH22_06135 [Fulvivirga sp. M361]